MPEQKYEFSYTIHSNKSSLPQVYQTLYSAAETAREKAYAAYSDFRVGAAVLLENGEIITGNNQENAAYPSGLCAERVALFYAKAQFPDAKVEAIAICTSAEKKLSPLSPCGNCRQVMSEYETVQESPIKIFFEGETEGIIEIASCNALLPFHFHGDLLERS